MAAPKLLLPNAEWMPSPHRSGSAPRRPDLAPRGVVHTTETRPGSAEAVRQSLEWPYHLLIEVRYRRILQLLDLAGTAYALKGATGYETNHAGRHCVQVSIVDYAKDIGSFNDQDLQWLATEVFAPLSLMCDIPNVWTRSYGANEGIVLASPSSPIRFQPMAWYEFSGWTYHQKAPGNDHWDPGKIDWRTIQQHMENTDMLNTSLDDKSTLVFLNKLPDFATHPLVGVWQEYLAVTGHYDGPINSRKSKRLLEAHAAFEEAEFGKGDDRIGARSWERLRERARDALLKGPDKQVIESLRRENAKLTKRRNFYAGQALKMRMALDRIQIDAGELVDAIDDAAEL